MRKDKIQLRSVKNVANSTTATIELPTGPRYHMVVAQLAYSSGTNTIAGALAHVTEARVLVNSRVQRRYPSVTINGSVVPGGQILRDLNILQGDLTLPQVGSISVTSLVSGYDCQGVPNTGDGVSLLFNFNEPWRANRLDGDALAWDSKPWENFKIELDLSAAIASSGAPAIVAYAIIDDMHVNQPQGIVKHLPGFELCGGVKYDITDLDKKDWYQTLSIYPDTGGAQTITKVTMRKGSEIIHELSASANAAVLGEYGLTPAIAQRTAGIYDIVLDHDDLLGSAENMDGIKAMPITVETGTAMAGTQLVMVQRLGSLE